MLLSLRVLLGQAQHLGQLAVAGDEAGLGVGPDPEDGAVLVAVAVGILDGRLRLADAPQPGDRLRQRRGRAGGQGGFELREDRLAAREVGIPRVGDVPPRPPRGGQGARDGLRSRFRRQDLDRAAVGPGRGRLIGQVPVQGIVARVGAVESREPVVVMPPDRGRGCARAPSRGAGSG